MARRVSPSTARPCAAVSEISGECLAVRARIVARWISALYDRALEGTDLTIAQVNLLVAIGALGPSAPSRVGSVLHMERSTVSRNLAPLIESGWLAADSSDAGRVRGVHLTSAGERVLERILPKWRAVQTETAKRLGKEGVAAIRRLGEQLLRPRAGQAAEG